MPEPHETLRLHGAGELAWKGLGLASPNPLVGCLITNDKNEIVGQGFHLYEQLEHAEIVALKQAGEKARGATLFVNLEPCNRTGRTAPCTEAIIAAGIRRVFVGMKDPNPKVAGGGIERLQAKGIEVILANEEDQEFFQRQNEAFSCWITTKRPFVTLKSALTLDGQLALPKTGKSKRRSWITSEEARAEVHRMRHASDALLTGIGTVLADDPHLTDRSGLPRRRRLLRVVLDTKLKLSPKSRLVQSADGDLLVYTAVSPESAKARTLKKAGVELLQANVHKGKIDLGPVLRDLGRRDILGVLLEAGPALNAAALSQRLVHKMVLFYAPKLAGDAGVPLVQDAISPFGNFRIRSATQFGPDFRVELSL